MMTSVVQELQQKGSCLLCNFLFSVLWRCWLSGRKGIIRSVKSEWWVAGMAICLKWGADLHIAQLMPLPLTVSCFSWIQIGFTFLVPAHLGGPRQRAVIRVHAFLLYGLLLNSLDVIQKGLLCRHSLRCCWLLTVVGFNQRWQFSKKYIIKFTGTCSVVCWWLKKLWDSVCGWEGHQKFATLTPLKYQMLLADPCLIEKLSLNH